MLRGRIDSGSGVCAESGELSLSQILEHDRSAVRDLLKQLVSTQVLALEKQQVAFENALTQRAAVLQRAFEEQQEENAGFPRIGRGHSFTGSDGTQSDTSVVRFGKLPMHNPVSQPNVADRVNAGLRRMTMANEFKGSKAAKNSLESPESFSDNTDQERSSRTLPVAPVEDVDSSFLTKLTRALQSHHFNTTIGLLIVLNAILIGVLSDFEVQCAFDDEFDCDPIVLDVLNLLNTSFTVIFAVELAVRLCVQRLDFCRARGWQWNIADAIVVVVSLVEEATLASAGLDFKYIRLLRLSRLVRTLRIVRTLPVFCTLRTMLNAIMNSAGSLIWAMVLIWFTMFLFAVAFTQGATQYAENPSAGEDQMELLDTFFSSLGMTLLTLFMCITGGLSWWEIINVLLQIHGLFAVLFGFYISLMVLALLNIVTGIFVNDALELAQLDRDLMARFELEKREADMEKFGSIFSAVDTSKTGKVTLEEFLLHKEKSGVKALFTVLGLDVSDWIAFFEALDVGGNGELNLEDFVMGCMNLRGSAKTLDMVTLMSNNHKIQDQLHHHAESVELKLKALELKFARHQVLPIIGGRLPLERESRGFPGWDRVGSLASTQESLDIDSEERETGLNSERTRRHL